MFKLFIWDLDNTLIASSSLLWGAFSWVAEEYGNKKMTPQEIVSLYGPPEDVVIEKIVGKEKKEERRRKRLFRNSIVSIRKSMMSWLKFSLSCWK
ncbi:MAG TPA: HAD hydrolase-like protein [Candidatus Atribacteria bacterium]|nr:HAD hydrolase-like protein [Candidatus Atribacteria bacterium]